MKTKLWCLIFGHDFRMFNDDDEGYRHIISSDYCRNCGLSKEECKIK
jgi:Pyruvate/2-oxoacid:ferredoxin oxidoreductase delta subunit